jgi:WD40 repeat protein
MVLNLLNFVCSKRLYKLKGKLGQAKKEISMKKIVSVFMCFLLLVSFSSVFVFSFAQGYTELWQIGMQVNDVAVSKNSLYVVAVNGSGVYFFSYNSSTPQWYFDPAADVVTTSFLSVAISADGNYVAVGTSEPDTSTESASSINVDTAIGNGRIFYWADATSLTGLPEPTWISSFLGEKIERGILDISDDGSKVAAGGSGYSIWYFDNCLGRTGPTPQNETWEDAFLPGYDGIVLALDMSSNGKYVAAGGYNDSCPFCGVVKLYKDAWTGPGLNWLNKSLPDRIIDVEVSDDGYAVAAVEDSVSSLYYWSDAISLSGSPAANWTRSHSFTCVDISSDGDSVAAGSIVVNCLHFWNESRTREGEEIESWVDHEANVWDIAISEDGEIIAACGDYYFNAGSVSKSGNGLDYRVVFYAANETEIEPKGVLNELCDKISMSGYGRIVAVGSQSYSHLYVFELYTIQPDGESTDTVGVGQDEYTVDEPVFATGSGFPSNTDIDIYIVFDDKWTDNKTIPPDLSNDGVNTVKTDGSGNIGPADVWQPPLVPGEYDMVFDTNRNGVYDEGIDVVDDPNHPGFEVLSQPEPVGGEIFPINNLALLTLLVFMIAISICSIRILGKKTIIS